MLDNFEFKNDVDNSIELLDEGGFIAVRIMGNSNHGVITIKKKDVVELARWLVDYLKE